MNNTDNPRYHNIFYYHRGPTKGSAAQKEKALENNVTKALINVLELCKGESVETKFIRWLGQKANVNLEPARIKIPLILKGPTEDVLRNAKAKLMLGIKPYWAEEFEPQKRRKSKSKKLRKGSERRFDGALVGQGWVVAIESKIESGMDKRQFKKEKSQLGKGTGEKIIDWRDLYNFFSSLPTSNSKGQPLLESKASFLINQFCDYLKLIGQVGFTGLQQRHFDFFVKGRLEEEKEEARIELRELMNTLGGDIYECRMVQKDYPEWDWVKGLRKKNREDKAYDFASLSFYPFKRYKTRTEAFCRNQAKRAYINIELQKDGLQVWVQVRKGCINKLRKKIESNKGNKKKLARKLLRIREKLEGDYFINLWHDDWRKDYPIVLRKKYRNSNEGFRVNDSAKFEVVLGLINEVSRQLQEHKIDKDLTFSLTRHFHKNEVIGYEGQKLVKRIAGTIINFHQFVDFANNK